MGMIVSGIGFVWMLYVVIKAIIIGDPVAGYPSLIVVVTLLGGIQLLAIGVIG